LIGREGTLRHILPSHSLSPGTSIGLSTLAPLVTKPPLPDFLPGIIAIVRREEPRGSNYLNFFTSPLSWLSAPAHCRLCCNKPFVCFMGSIPTNDAIIKMAAHVYFLCHSLLNWLDCLKREVLLSQAQLPNFYLFDSNESRRRFQTIRLSEAGFNGPVHRGVILPNRVLSGKQELSTPHRFGNLVKACRGATNRCVRV